MATAAGSSVLISTRRSGQGWFHAALNLLWVLFFALTSVYGLLAFLPYTYHAFIKAPPYQWQVWFVRYYGALYWTLCALIALVHLPARRSKLYQALIAYQFLLGIYISGRGAVANIQNDWSAYALAVAALAPAIAAPLLQLRSEARAPGEAEAPPSFISFSATMLIAVAIALLSAGGIQIRQHPAALFHARELMLVFWSALSHLVVAMLAVSVLNLIRYAAARTSRPQTTTWVATGVALFILLAAALQGFLANALSFDGWAAYLYAAGFAMAIAGLTGITPLWLRRRGRERGPQPTLAKALATCAVLLVSCGVAVGGPAMIGEGDWNSVLHRVSALAAWLGISLGVYRLWPKRAAYSWRMLVLVLGLTLGGYKALQATQIFWARALGPTDGDVSVALEQYAAQDVSFQMAHHALGNGRSESCGQLCLILRQYTNIRDARAVDLKLVDELTPVMAARPNIFILVLDSVRQDYLGAYNPEVDFTPNLDGFARDSVVMRNAFTQYAGTTLSEPAIWSGAALLHTHYLQPFARVNSLEKMLHADGYEMFVSWDTVLRELLSPSPSLHKLDEDKQVWNQFEACSTLEQLEAALDGRTDRSRPLFFYAQPMNVHQFARNNLPGLNQVGWAERAGFNRRATLQIHQVDQCFGRFVTYLKARQLYDNSIIIVTSDHGDGLGQEGRQSHSLSVFPEIMRVPLLIHLPREMQQSYFWDETRLATLTDITPSLYALLGHGPILRNAEFGLPLFARSREELQTYAREHVLLASDVRAVYGILADNGRWFYSTVDSPAQSFLFDLESDPRGKRNLVNEAQKIKNNQLIIQHLTNLSELYQYKPGSAR